MCGIAGVLHFDQNRSVDAEKLKEMCNIIRHRGPDGEGYYVKGCVGLGHRRLSIIDLDTGGQPMMSKSGDLVIVFNGEIYNYIELREELIYKGHVFSTDSDTEVILSAYKEWGPDCQKRLNGMWAFAIWNERNHELFLSRDRIGEKPLHYCVYNNSIVFGSEMKSLFKYGIPRDKRLELVELYLTFTNIPEPNTFYKDVYKLLPGHYLLVKNGLVKEIKYWDLPEIDESNMISDKKMVYQKFEELFYDSVKIRMRSDVPFGAFLSGGLDSSSIVAVMSEIADYKVKTFTIGFDDSDFDESKLAEEVAIKFRTNHLRGTVYSEDFDTILSKAAFHYDEPFGDSSAIPTGYVSKFAAEKVKMVLTGDGGDEVLSGYRSYSGLKLAAIINSFPSTIVNSLPNINDQLARIVKGNIRYKLNKISSVIRTAKLDFSDRIVEKSSYTDYDIIKQLSRGIEGNVDAKSYLNEFMKKCQYKDDFYKMMFLNFKFDLPNDYLVKVDRMSMAYSLETRLPFLDYRLVEFMAMVDKNLKMNGWERKSVLRNTIGNKLPESLLKAPKRGFGIPLREWFKEKSFNEKLSLNLKEVMNLTDKKTVEMVIENNRSGKVDNGNFIWALLMLDKNLK